MANLKWMALEASDLAHVAAGWASCIADGQMLTLVDGSVMSATVIADTVARGQRIAFRTPNVGGWGECANPVIGVVRTRGAGVRIVFHGGRAVELTTGHILPLDAEELNLRDPYAEKDHWLPVAQQMVIRAGQVAPGMELLDGVVESVQSLGDINAVRLWTAHPAWLPTQSRLRVGSRWHEILHAWAEVEEVEDEEWGDCQTNAVSATGWIWGTGERHSYGWEIDPQTDQGEYKPYARGGGGVRLGDLGNASLIRATIAARRQSVLFPAVNYVPEDVAERYYSRTVEETAELPLNHRLGDKFGEKFAKLREHAKPHMRLAWSRPAQLTDLLVKGSEVRGEPIIVPEHEAEAA